jgi:ABC-type bacteriocin/lantibiotic exporter with double-glycine peptidase domain
MFQFSTTLAYISAIVVPLYAMLLFYNVKQIKKEQNEVMKNYSLVESNYFDSLGGMDDIQNYNTSLSFSLKNQLLFKHFQGKIKTLGLTQSKLSFLAEISGAIITIGVLAYGSINVTQKILLLGEMMASFSLLANMLPAVNRLVDANISLQGASIAVQRLMDMLLVNKEAKTGGTDFSLQESILIKNGSYSWKPGKELLKDISIEIRKGEITSLWGPSGSGKSTLVQILHRKYELNTGDLLIDNIPANIFALDDYRKNIGVIPQNIKIFNGTILENILLGRTYADPQEFYRKLNDTGLEEFFKRFDNGIFTIIGEEGGKLSGGEKQLVALTRALLDKPEVLIVDEGLSGIDLQLEEMIFDVINKYSKEHAVLLITHSIRAILRANYVYLIENGTIIQKGIPQILISEEGKFKNLYELSYSLLIPEKDVMNSNMKVI